MKPTAQQRTAIADALHPAVGAKVSDGTADISSYPVPGLAEDAVWQVAITDTDHPLQTYVGAWPDGVVRVLADDQPAFFELVAARGGARIADPETALGYVLAFLEVTRGPSVLVRPIADVSDIPWRPGSADEEARRTALLADPPITEPTARPDGNGYRVELWLIVDQRVQFNSFDVTTDGAIAAEFRVVAADLPLPIAR
ncbi:MAG TPA: hypothetical protein VFG33_23075 [Kribbella sp.]|uniref:hypothetical protein n=1 Tax=Kribbella sp. TaxID=1871183 RepID=UPI002D76A6E7|nr:hypothetical protein [Kribbella sp.]HET6296285.1 hypothetical protein [Kribbella sp.]